MSTQRIIYLDYAAATPLDPKVQKAMEPYFAKQFYNPSATYLASRQIRQDIDEARKRVAGWLGSKPPDITFTAGGTEANNLAIHGVMRKYPKAKLLVSGVEHESVVAPAKHYPHEIISVNEDGRLNMADLQAKLDAETVLVSVMYANNEVGTIQPIKEISRYLRSVRDGRHKSGNNLPLFFHTDACQAANYLDLHVSRLGVDLMTLNGGKLYGPKQTGSLYVQSGITLEPLVDGGGQERGLRSGTENIPGIIGLATALDIAQTTKTAESERLQSLQNQFISLVAQKLPSARINGSLKHRLPNNVHFTLPGRDNERLIFQLDEAGIQAAAGSACSASDDEPSHVLKAMGISTKDAQSSLRFTMGRSTTPEAVNKTVNILKQLL